jgi:rhomboid protease GluP
MTKPGSGWKSIAISWMSSGQDSALKIVIAANVAFFLFSLLIGARSMSFSMHPFSFLSPGNKALILLGATGVFPIDSLHRWWTVISANYLHGGLLHLVFNMLALSQIGHLVAREYGVARMLSIYTLGGASGFFVSYLAGVNLTIGASAAVCSLIGAMLYYGKSRGGLYGDLLYKRIGGWAAGIFFFGLLVPGINNWGHGGGIAAGIALGYLLGYAEKRPESSLDKTVGALCSLATGAVLLLAAGSAIYYMGV